MPTLKTWGLLLALSFLTSAAFGQTVDDATRAAARTLGYAGVEAYQAGDYSGAQEKLEKAYAVLKAPTLGLWSARALAKTGRLVEASERYLEVTRLQVTSGDVAVQQQAQAEAAEEQTQLAARIPTLVVSVEGAPPDAVSVTLDGTPFSSALLGERVPVNPGPHVVAASYNGQSMRLDVSASEGSAETAPLRFTLAPAATAPVAEDPTRAAPALPPPEPAAAARESDSRGVGTTLGWVSLGVGAAALAAGGGFALSARQDRDYLRGVQGCDLERNECPESQRDRVDSYNNKRIYSGASLIGGGVLAATGLVLLLTDSSDSDAPVALGAGPGRLWVRGWF